ncbi:MAG: sialate O-acetylesterase, partial [Thermoguttaceae bacterium]|nr:sialate O-acetylesterase [Thermoguttaceae bacterium]
LWHQGESDCTATGASTYEAKLTELFKAFRQEFDSPRVPIIVGELSREYGKSAELREQIGVAQRAVIANCAPAAFVESEGLTLNKDRVHFDRASQIEFGRRYFEAFSSLEK